MKKYLFGLLLASILAAAAIWWFNRKTTLVDLQKQYLFAKTEEEKNKIINRLEKYYLNLDVPSALSDSIEHDFAGLLKRATVDLPAYTNGKAENKNPYVLENNLRSLVKSALVAQARNESETFRQLMDHAHKTAAVVDAGTQNNYWVPLVERVLLFDTAQAEAWLKADLAQTRCKAYQDSESKFSDAEFYASLGLKSLQQASDERLRLDVIQRLQYVLYFHRSMNELALGLAQKSLPQANKLKYHLRSNSLVYHQAEILASIGQYHTALTLYETVIHNAKTFVQIAELEWFTIQSLLGKGHIYLELGEFERALDVCKEVETHKLNPKATILLPRLRGYIYTCNGNYEQAEKELQMAIMFAETAKDTSNLIRCLNNLGVMFERLAEYDLALDYYNQAKSLFGTASLEIGLRMLILNNIADIAVTKYDFVLFGKISQEAERLAQSMNMPSWQAQLFRNIGNMHKKAKEYSTAMKYFQEAASIFSENGFLRLALGAKIDLVDCLIGLAKFDEAQKILISEIELIARAIDDIERVIDADGRLAKVQYRKGDITKAMESSKRLLYGIEKMSFRFNSIDRLMAYRQKIYDLLKDVVLYEIASHGHDSAFVKLDYAKAYALKTQLINNQENNYKRAVSQKYLNLDSVQTELNEKSLVIDYMVTEDTLHAFVLDHEGLQLFSKNLNMEMLKKTVEAYNDSICRTIQIFQHYDARKLSLHYAGTVELGQKLYLYLFGWPEIESRLKQVGQLYIIPDEFLYELPFATLIANSSDSRTFVVNRSAVLTLPSAGFLQFQNTVRFSSKFSTKKVLISADQRFHDSKKFVSLIKTLFPLSEELTIQNTTFTKDEVLAKLQKDYQIYIFIGHGSGNSKYPDRSYIELSVKTPNTSTAKIIRLSMSDLKSIDWLGAEMVMLVGCETASGKLYRGTGISGLHQGFLSMGAQNVLGNLWEVDASHAISQAENFLTSWVANWNPSQALRECQLKAIQELQEHSYYKQPYPYFWGSSMLLTVKP